MKRMMRADIYQVALIGLGVVAALLFGIFLHRELFPEYKIYQEDFIALEKFRSSYTGEPVSPFKVEVKQIVIEREDRGPPIIDRCITCHVALQIPEYSPTKIARDESGKVIFDAEGIPVQVPNEKYIWGKLDQKITELSDAKVFEQLKSQGKDSEVYDRLEEAEKLAALKTAKVGDRVYDVTKALSMHPLIGKETRPFEYHPLEEYGCVSCHNGNGRGLTTEKAHGPVLDEQYGIEFMGPEPQFIEEDPQNDPAFARMFNHKPGHELLFQTTPIFIGPLIQAKCIQCHQSGQTDIAKVAEDMPLLHSALTDIESLTQNYHRGEELYIAQACYACHRITGFSRGGVGPELTFIGNGYPWYIKESIVWPQADLSTSTMPNEQLDHEELQDLMTYLLAQTGRSAAVSQTEHRMKVREWESGRKQSWEKALTPAQILDLNYSMTVFAAEGCAACHRLKGFESNVGYAIQKDQKPDFEALYQEHLWFTQLFPENILGSQIVKTLEKDFQEIDKRIVNDVRTNSILEHIEKEQPGTIESFYTPFKYAARAKDYHYAQLIKSETDTQKQKALQEQLQDWKERVNRVLLMFVQEYGLGRLICPRPNWSGVYRSDEWLMEHFRNPSAHTPRSMMPVMPFDDSKFYALTHMLDVLGIRNRDAVRAIWDHYGFNPELAFQIHCAQCHGENRVGNGPVAEWIYPIPKNLRNADFLRSLTRENAMQSIEHGVKGTPMPPWGEVALDKPTADGIPVLTKEEIAILVDWMFSSLPGSRVIQSPADIPKWQYTPEDILQELKQEGDQLKADIKSAAEDVLSFLPRGEGYYASLNPVVYQSVENKEQENVSDIFDIVQASPENQNQEQYFIKRKYYTTHNIEQGKAFFELNCAVCHGAEADGSGIRAAHMSDAKPRMLTNLDWINTRDDLRLLRSIKYGVPGTAMTPWGDQTSALQRLQLVIFIRSLTQDREQRETLSSTLYKTYETSLLNIDRARIAQYTSLDKLQKEYEQIRLQQRELEKKVKHGSAVAQEATKNYEKELELTSQLEKLQSIDRLYTSLKAEVKKEMDLYHYLGLDLLLRTEDESIIKKYLKLISLNADRFKLDASNHLILGSNSESEQQVDALSAEIVSYFSEKLEELQKKKKRAEGQLPSPARSQELTRLAGEIATEKKFNEKLSTDLKEAKRARERQKEIYEQFKKQN